MHGVSGVGAVVDAARFVLEGLVLLRLVGKAGGSGTVVGLLAVLRSTGSRMPELLGLAGKAAGGPRRRGRGDRSGKTERGRS